MVKAVKCNSPGLVPQKLEFPALTHLTMPEIFNEPLDKYLVASLVPNITSICFPIKSIFNQELVNLPPTLKHLILGNFYNGSLDNLPSGLTHLSTGFEFNKPVNHLPPNLTHLEFGVHFNKRADNLPDSLTHVDFGVLYRKQLAKFPPNLTHLILGDAYSFPINNLPSKLIYFFVGEDFNQQITGLPASLKYLLVMGKYTNQLTLPPHLIEFYGFAGNCVSMPNSLTIIEMQHEFNTPITAPFVPTTITHLTFGERFNVPISWLPPNLRFLEFEGDFDHPLPKLPDTIIELNVGIGYNQPLEGKLPDGLKSLKLGAIFTQTIQTWPSQLEWLVVWGACVNAMGSSIKSLPDTLTRLQLYCYKDIPLQNIYFRFPPNLTHLELFKETLFSLPCKIPSTVTHLLVVGGEELYFKKSPSGCNVTVEGNTALHRSIFRPKAGGSRHKWTDEFYEDVHYKLERIRSLFE